MMTILRTFGEKLLDAMAPPIAQTEPDDVFRSQGRVHSLSAVLMSLADRHSQDFDALAAELGVPANVDFVLLAFESARISDARVNFTTITPCVEFLRAAAAGKAFGESRPAVHSVDWTSLEPAGPTYRAAARALEDWFIYYGGVECLLPDFSDGTMTRHVVMTVQDPRGGAGFLTRAELDALSAEAPTIVLAEAADFYVSLTPDAEARQS